MSSRPWPQRQSAKYRFAEQWNKPPLGRLEKVDLTTYWLREDTEFRPWLAQDDKLEPLSETANDYSPEMVAMHELWIEIVFDGSEFSRIAD